MATPNKRIIFFDSIGIVGPLINNNNEKEVKKISRHMLGNVLNDDDLLETLYAYLSNGGNLELTSQEIALSLSGLRYRLRKIEDILGKDIKDPIYSYQLLLAIQSLLVLGEIEI